MKFIKWASPIPLKVVASPASRVGITIIEGETDPAIVIMLIMVVGRNCKPAEANSIVMMIGKVIVPLLSSRCSTAFIPSGTDAPPIPRSEDEIDSDKYFFASAERFLPQSLSIIGDNVFEILFDSGVFSIIFIIPSQTAYIASNSKQRLRAFLDEFKIVGRMVSGAKIDNEINEIIIINDQILFMVNYILQQLKLLELTTFFSWSILIR